MTEAIWRSDLDALRFALDDGRLCFVHRRAFRSLIGRDPDAADCLDFFARNSAAFLSAALARQGLPETSAISFHLTSRDVKRMLARTMN